MAKVSVATLEEIAQRLLNISERCLLDKDRIDALKAAAVVTKDVISLDADPNAKTHALTLTFAEKQTLAKKLSAAD